MIDVQAILAAQRALRELPDGVVETPLERSHAIGSRTGCEVYLKCEHLQTTGSFKLRGATNKLLSLTDAQKRRGIVTASSGNHGLAVSHSAGILGLEATVYVPETVSPMKEAGIEARGAKVVKVPGEPLEAELEARRVAQASDRVFISPYNDEQVITGQGTIGAELLNQQPELEAVFVSVGGGGLISGIGSFLKQRKPEVEIVAAWPEVARSLHDCLLAGEIVDVPEQETLSDGTAGGVEPDAVTFPLCQQVIDRKVLVSEAEIADAMRILAAEERYMVEGAAGVALAALLKVASEYQGKKVAVVLCGRNVTLQKYLRAIVSGVS